jgi:hypothetical protein
MRAPAHEASVQGVDWTVPGFDGKGRHDPQDRMTGPVDSEPHGREPSVGELRALAAHARQRVALYRRRVLLGRGEPRRLAELERVSDGAAGRVKRAIERERTP